MVFLQHNQSEENALRSQLEFPTVVKKAQSVMQVKYIVRKQQEQILHMGGPDRHLSL